MFEVLFGGARGGGKTDGSLGEWFAHQHARHRHASGVFFRRQLTQLDDVIARSHAIYSHAGGRFLDQKKTWVFTNGARLKFRYLERDSDAEKYQGHSYTRVYMEELTNFPSPAPVMKLMATLRCAEHNDIGFRGTGNPGGPGHFWVKARYIDPSPLGYQIIPETFNNPFNGESITIERIFIPSRLTDNQRLMATDPLYVARLQQAGNDELVRAWLEGDWNVAVGAFFDDFRAHHIVPDMDLPADWPRFLSMDWGSAAPFAVHWWAVSDGSMDMFPRGALVCYREWYGAKGPNIGLKLPVEDIAEGIVKRCQHKEYACPRNVAGTDLFKEEGGPSLFERMHKHSRQITKGAGAIQFGPADTARLAGWDQVRGRLRGYDGRPMLYFMQQCKDAIRTLPGLPHDELRIEDIDTDAEDHAADSVRYGCMARPWVPPEPQPDSGPSPGTFDWLLKVTKNQNRNRRVIPV